MPLSPDFQLSQCMNGSNRLPKFSTTAASGVQRPTPSKPVLPSPSSSWVSVSASSTPVSKQLPIVSQPPPVNPPSSDLKDQKGSLHSRPQKSLLNTDGCQQNVTGPTGSGGKTGRQNLRDEGKGSDSKDGKPNDSVVDLMAKLGLLKVKTELPQSVGSNITRKHYRFGSDDHEVFPWSRGAYAAGPPQTWVSAFPNQGDKWAMLGSSNIANTATPTPIATAFGIALGGIGWQAGSPSTGWNSNDIAVLLTKIPLWDPNSSSANLAMQFQREGPAIFIHKVKGKAVIRRVPHLTPGINLTPQQSQLLPTRYPICTSYLQVEPISQEIANTNMGQIPSHSTGLPYPNNLANSLQCDFLSYNSTAFLNAVEPFPTINTGTYPHWIPGPSGEGVEVTDPKRYAHRTPVPVTKIHSYYHKSHGSQPDDTSSLGAIQGYSEINVQSIANGTPNDTVAGTDMHNVAQPPRREYEIPIEHTFEEPLKVIYDPMDTTGSRCIINPMRWRYHQDITGMLLNYTDNTQSALMATGAAPSCKGYQCLGYKEYMSYEIWVEFSDCPTQL